MRYATGVCVRVEGVAEGAVRASRSAGTPKDWTKCFICHNKTHKKIRDMHNICTFEACKSIRQAAESKGDDEMLHALHSVNNDLIAAEAKYHKACFASYVSRSNLKHQSFKENDGETVYDTAFKEMAAELTEGIAQGKAYDMTQLLSKYRELLDKKEVKAETYSKQHLKLRLKKHFGEKIVFHQHPDKSKPEVIYSSQISVQDILNAAAQNSPHTRVVDRQDNDNCQQIINVVRRLRKEIRKCDGIIS